MAPELLNMRHVLGCLILLVHYATVIMAITGFPCSPKGSCGCVYKNEHGDQMEISMSVLNNKNGTAYFQEIPGTTDWKYDINLCTGFTVHGHGDGCEDVTGCQLSTDSGSTETFAMGRPGSKKFGNFFPSNQTLVVQYSAKGDDGNTRVMLLFLVCTKDDEISAKFRYEDDRPKVYYYLFNIKSKTLCPSKVQNVLSIGSIIVIVFFVVLIVYFVAGILFMKYRRGATGKEIIPNLSFWSSLPGLIKDGCVFFGGTIKRLCKREQYDEI